MFGGFRSAAASYAQVDLEARVAASDPHGLIQMLFDGAVVAVAQADACLAAGDVPGKGMAVSRAIRILEEGLKASLDPSGGELARHLGDLYSYMAQQLLLASIKNEAAGFAEVRRLLIELRDAWSQAKPAAAASEPEGLATAA
jgi:flagellar secretion chaperone FliS